MMSKCAVSKKFINAGDKVKVTMRFRGREMAHQQIGLELLHKVRDQFEETTKVEALPKLEGRQMIMVLAPKISLNLACKTRLLAYKAELVRGRLAKGLPC